MLELLVSLSSALRREGFKVGPTQHIDAARLLKYLHAQGAHSLPLEQLAAYLAPIYCCNAEQQQRFIGLLTKASFNDESSPPQPPVKYPSPKSLVYLPLLMFLVAGLVYGLYYYYYWEYSTTVSIFDDMGPLPLANVKSSSDPIVRISGDDGRVNFKHVRADFPLNIQVDKTEYDGATTIITSPSVDPIEIELVESSKNDVSSYPKEEITQLFSRTPRQQSKPIVQIMQPAAVYSYGRIALLCVPIVGALSFWLCLAAWRRAWLSRWPDQLPGSVKTLSSNARRELGLLLNVGRIGHELRRRRWQVSNELNIDATLSSTLEHMGAPRAVFGSRVEPEYLVLVDESSRSDHLARLADEFIVSLQAYDVSLTRYYFSDSPMLCTGPVQTGPAKTNELPTVTLDEIYGRFPHHRLIVISDGKACFETVSGMPEQWIDFLLKWPDPMLLTPIDEGRWGRREWALSRIGLALLPLSRKGLSLLGNLQGSDQPAASPPPSAAHVQVPQWVRDPLSMLLAVPPSKGVPEELRQELLQHLGSPAYSWLCGCAVYPEIHWGMTVRIGVSLLGDGEEFEKALSRLVQLPWLRESYMPDWVRGMLIQHLSIADRQKISTAITDILESALVNSSGEIPLSIVSAPQVTGWWWRLYRYWSGSREDKTRRAKRDLVFLRFMQSQPQLAVPVLKRFQRLFFVDGLWSLGVRATPLLGSVILATALVAWHWPSMTAGEQIQFAPDNTLPFITALTMPIDGRSSVLVGYDDGEIWEVTAEDFGQWGQNQSSSIHSFAFADKNRSLVRLHSEETVEVLANNAEPDPLRGEFLAPAGGGRIFVDYRATQFASLSADGNRIAVFNGRSGQQTFDVTRMPPILCAAFSHDGVLVAANSDGLHPFDPNNRLEDIPLAGIVGCTGRPDSRMLVGWTESKENYTTLWRFDLDTRSFAAPVTVASEPQITELGPSADSKLIWIRRSNQVAAVDAETGQPRGTIRSVVEQMAASSDGTQLAISTNNGEIQIWQLHDPSPPPPKKTERYLLAVSLEYSSPGLTAPLHGTHRDARALAKILQQRYGYQTRHLTDPMKSEFIDALKSIAETATPEQEIVVYFNGHSTGEGEGKEFVMLMANADKVSPDTTVSATELNELLDLNPARRVLVIIESVNSRLARKARHIPDHTSGRTRLLLSDADDTEMSFITSTNEYTGVLIAAVIKELESATTPIGAQQLLDKASVSMRDGPNKQTPHLDLMPAAGHTGGDFVFDPIIAPTHARFEVRNHQLIGDRSTPVRFLANLAIGPTMANPQLIVVHSTGTPSIASYIETIAKSDAEPSVHAVIGRDGSIVQFSPFNRETGSVGGGTWNGQTNLSPISISIAFENVGELQPVQGTLSRDIAGRFFSSETANLFFEEPAGSSEQPRTWLRYTDEQTRVGVLLIDALKRAYPSLRTLVGHSDIDPERRADPGPAFPWPAFQEGLLFVRTPKVGSATPAKTLASIRTLLTDSSSDVRLRTLLELRQNSDISEDLVIEISTLLSDDRSEIRSAAAEVLGIIGPAAETVLPLVEELLHDGEADVRINAVNAIGSIGVHAEMNFSQLEVLRLKDPDYRVRSAAETVLQLLAPASESSL